jgi:protein TonB
VQLSGNLRKGGYPRGPDGAALQGVVGVRFLVDVDGRARECEVTDSSGSAQLDDTTCRRIEQLYRFRPSKDPRGRPVPATMVQDEYWIID